MVGNDNNRCRFTYLDNAIFQPSKAKLVLFSKFSEMKFENIACLLDEMDFIFPSLFDSRECSIRPGIDFSSSILS